MSMIYPMYYSQRLMQKLTQLRGAQVTLVEASAGYGKTTAVRKALADCPRVYWHTAVRNGVLSNYTNLCYLVGQIDSDIARRLSGLGFPNRSNAREIAAAMRTIVCSEDTYLVMDNFQYFLPALPELIVSALVNPTCSRLHVVMLSHCLESVRYLLAEPQTALFIGPSDLCLSKEEIADYYAQEGFPLTQAQLDTLYEKGEGWIAVVSLVLQSVLRNGVDGLKADMIALLTDLLWNRLGTADQEKLLVYSYFDSLSAAQICDMEGTETLSAETHALLKRLPLTRMDNIHGMIEMHQLLREYLSTRFDHVSRKQAETATYRAGLWFRAHGETVRAISCFYRIGDYGMILSLDLINLFFVRINGKPFEDIAQEIADNVPDAQCARHPISMLRLAYILFGICRFESYDRLMRRLRHIIEDMNDPALLGEWTLMSAFSDFPDLEKMGEKYKAAASMIQGKSRAISSREPYMFGCPSMWVLFHTKSGCMEKNAELFSRVLSVYTAITDGHGSGADEIYRGEALCVQGRFEEARLCAYKAMYQAEIAGQVTVSYASAMLLGIISVYQSDYVGLQKAIEYLETRASAYPDMQNAPMNAWMLETVRGYLLGLLLETKQYPEWVKDDGDANMNFTFMNFMAYQSRVTDLVLQKKYHQAIAKTETLLKADSRLCSVAARNFMLVGLALCYLAIGHINKAAEMLDQALTISAPDRNYTFIARFRRVFSVLFLHPRIARRHKGAILEIRALKIHYAASDEELAFSSITASDLPQKLSNREREIALLAAEGMRNREIAKHLHISEITVKSHMSAVFRKLRIDRRSSIIDLLQ